MNLTSRVDKKAIAPQVLRSVHIMGRFSLALRNPAEGIRKSALMHRFELGTLEYKSDVLQLRKPAL